MRRKKTDLGTHTARLMPERAFVPILASGSVSHARKNSFHISVCDVKNRNGFQLKFSPFRYGGVTLTKYPAFSPPFRCYEASATQFFLQVDTPDSSGAQKTPRFLRRPRNNSATPAAVSWDKDVVPESANSYRKRQKDAQEVIPLPREPSAEASKVPEVKDDPVLISANSSLSSEKTEKILWLAKKFHAYNIKAKAVQGGSSTEIFKKYIRPILALSQFPVFIANDQSTSSNETSPEPLSKSLKEEQPKDGAHTEVEALKLKPELLNSPSASEGDPALTRVIDAGSVFGEGGLVLGLVNPSWNVSIVEPNSRKVALLNECIQHLQLTNVQVVNDVPEAVGRKQEHREKYDLAICTHDVTFKILSELCLPLVKIDGRLLSYRSKAAIDSGEVFIALQGMIAVLGGGLEVTQPLKDAEGEEVYLVVLKKVRETPGIFPRAAYNLGKSPPGVF
mmetsp:Transcript_18185/g.29879  ORF Transcript_18185/g.29879 Transcript_18185/m.29879 type:complete len:450 (+) Transcript_18185:39-1388(+)